MILKEVLLKKKLSQNVNLDFSQVSFFSRSFVDELLNIIHDLENEKVKVTIQNLRPQLRGMMGRIQATKAEIQKATA